MLGLDCVDRMEGLVVFLGVSWWRFEVDLEHLKNEVNDEDLKHSVRGFVVVEGCHIWLVFAVPPWARSFKSKWETNHIFGDRHIPLQLSQNMDHEWSSDLSLPRIWCNKILKCSQNPSLKSPSLPWNDLQGWQFGRYNLVGERWIAAYYCMTVCI